MLKRRKIIVLTICIFLIGIAVIAELIQRPRRSVGAFASAVKEERYEAASQFLRTPSSIKKSRDGSLVIVDQSGKSITIRPEILPFAVGGGRLELGEHSMTALEPSTDGILQFKPAVLYFSYDGWKLRIDGVAER